jgi:peptide/nickel transport system substrate-binding protein
MRRWGIIFVFVFSLLMMVLVSFASGQEGRVLRITGAWPNYIDPGVGNSLSSTISYVNLYDALVYPDAEGRPLPHAAKSWEVSDDGLVWTFHLRKDILFHDGTKLTARDVKFSMDRMRTIGEGFGYLFTGRVKETEVVDDYTVRFKLSKPFGPFLIALYRLSILNEKLVKANIKSKGTYGEMGDYGKEFLLTHDAGSGPYMVKQFRLEEQLVMEKFPKYWLPIPAEAPEIVRFIGTTEPATIRTMISRRELEISDTYQTEENMQAMTKIEGVQIAQYTSGVPFVYMMHTRKPPLDDVRFRRAMAYATDYKTVREKIYPGSEEMIGPVPLSNFGATPQKDYPHERDLEKAKEELKKSKYFGELEKQEVQVDWCKEVPDEEKVALLFQANMADIGIKVKVTKTPWMTMLEETANMDLAPHIQTTFANPGMAETGLLLAARYHSSAAKSYTQNEWLLDPKLDAMIDNALGTIDEKQRIAKYDEIGRYLTPLVPTINMFASVRKQVYQAAYVDWPLDELPGKFSGYAYAFRYMKVFPEKRSKLLGK